MILNGKTFYLEVNFSVVLVFSFGGIFSVYICLLGVVVSVKSRVGCRQLVVVFSGD